MIHLTPMFHGFGLAQPGFVGLTFERNRFETIVPLPGGARPGDLILALSAKAGGSFGAPGAGWTSAPALQEVPEKVEARLLYRILDGETEFDLGMPATFGFNSLIAIRAAAFKDLGDTQRRDGTDATICIAPGIDADGNGREVALACFVMWYGQNMPFSPNNEPSGIWVSSAGSGEAGFSHLFLDVWASSVLPAGTTPAAEQEITLSKTPTSTQTNAAQSLGFQILLERPA